MSENADAKPVEVTNSRRARLVLGLMMAAMLAGLGGCAQSTPAQDGSAGQAPGSFNVHLNGRLTNAFGAATP